MLLRLNECQHQKQVGFSRHLIMFLHNCQIYSKCVCLIKMGFSYGQDCAASIQILYQTNMIWKGPKRKNRHTGKVNRVNTSHHFQFQPSIYMDQRSSCLWYVIDVNLVSPSLKPYFWHLEKGLHMTGVGALVEGLGEGGMLSHNHSSTTVFVRYSTLSSTLPKRCSCHVPALASSRRWWIMLLDGCAMTSLLGFFFFVLWWWMQLWPVHTYLLARGASCSTLAAHSNMPSF